jgi:hypothetical protein
MVLDKLIHKNGSGRVRLPVFIVGFQKTNKAELVVQLLLQLYVGTFVFNVTQYGLVERYQNFVETCYLHI